MNITLEIIETIAELKAATPAGKFAEALRTSIKVLEMDKGLDEATKALAINEYKKALAAESLSIPAEEVESIALIALDMKQRKLNEQRSRYIEDITEQYERQLQYNSIAKLKAIVAEHGLVVKGRGKAAYINALVAEYRRNVEAQA